VLLIIDFYVRAIANSPSIWSQICFGCGLVGGTVWLSWCWLSVQPSPSLIYRLNQVLEHQWNLVSEVISTILMLSKIVRHHLLWSMLVVFGSRPKKEC